MARSVKSRRIKANAVPMPPRTPPQIIKEPDIIPGLLSASQWRQLVAQEKGEEVVADILNELMDDVMERCYKVHMERQLVPFVVSLSRNLLVRCVEGVFPVKDEGEWPNADPLWEEDREPQPCDIDSWAQGCVPVVYSRSQVTDLEPTLPQKESLSNKNPEKENQNKQQSVKSRDCRGNASKPAALKPSPPLRREQRRMTAHLHKVPRPLPNAPPSVQPVAESTNQKKDLGNLRNQPRAKSSAESFRLPRLGVTQRGGQVIWPGFEVLESSTSQAPSVKARGRLAPEKPIRRRTARHEAVRKSASNEA